MNPYYFEAITLRPISKQPFNSLVDYWDCCGKWITLTKGWETYPSFSEFKKGYCRSEITLGNEKHPFLAEYWEGIGKWWKHGPPMPSIFTDYPGDREFRNEGNFVQVCDFREHPSVVIW